MKGLNIISLGLGVQSTALYYMSSIGYIPKADYAIFSDPGKEKAETYKYLEYLIDWQNKNSGIPIIIRKERNLFKDLLHKENSNGDKFAPIPAFTLNEDKTIGMLRRQCTGEYKIAVVNNAIRDLYGLKPRQRRPITRVWMGITLDEIERLAIPSDAWRINTYPFVGYDVDRKGSTKINMIESRMTRSDVLSWLIKNKLPIPPKSSCIFCPYQSDRSWATMSPEDFEDACKIDDAIRDSTKKGINNPAFLHNSCKPFTTFIHSNILIYPRRQA